MPKETLPNNAQDAYAKYEEHGWQGNVPGQTEGTRAGRKFKNDMRDGSMQLPDKDSSGRKITYREYDVNNKSPGYGRDGERFVRGSDGSVYYTASHYGDFVRLI